MYLIAFTIFTIILIERSFTYQTAESAAYHFGLNGGLITFTYPAEKRPDTKYDYVTLKLLTDVKNAIIMRVDSATSSDIIEMQLINGNLVIIYNLGNNDINIGDLSVKLNDNQYHIINFTRSGPNSTLQIDNNRLRTHHPGGRHLTVLNAHSKVQIGGKRNLKTMKIDKPFQGIITNFDYNGQRILDYAARNDQLINIEGNIKLLTKLPIVEPNKDNSTKSTSNNSPQMQEPQPIGNEDSDSLIISGAGSGCYDDEDECSSYTDNGSGDELITPVYISLKSSTVSPVKVKSSSSPSSSNNVDNNNNKLSNCDDEEEDECVDGSGSGESINTKNTGDNYNYNSINNANNIDFKLSSTPSSPSSDYDRNQFNQWNTPTYIRPIVQPMVTPTPDYEDRSIIYTSRPIPPPIPSYPNRNVKTQRPTPPPRPTGKPEIYQLPIPEMPVIEKEVAKPAPTYSKTSAYRTALVIGLVAILLLIIVIIAPLIIFIKVRYRNQGIFKMGENKDFQFRPVSGTPPLLTSASQQTQLNGNNGETGLITINEQKLNKLPKKKNLKEWYV